MKKSFCRCYKGDASRLKGKVIDVLHPGDVEEACEMVRDSERIVIRGAGTGLAGGAVPQGDVVLDMSRLEKISDFDGERKTVVVEAGVVLDDLQEFLGRRSDLEFPVRPSSHAVCTIGGMVATNAVGNRGMRYGKVDEWVKWVEVIDSRGRVERKGVTEMSDYVGMEGITGVIVKICLKLNRKVVRSCSLLKLGKIEDVVQMTLKLKQRSDVCGVEFMDKIVSVGVGFEEGYYLLVEFVEGGERSEEGGVRGEDVVVDYKRMTGKAYDRIMRRRDAVYPFVAGQGYTRIEDPKIMVNRLPEFLTWLEMKGVPTFGHIGTGILHPCFSVEQERLIPEMMRLVRRLGGMVSGEHGIGLLKREFVEVVDRKILETVKRRLDSDGKFNVGKVVEIA